MVNLSEFVDGGLRYSNGDHAYTAAVYEDEWLRHEAARAAYRRCEIEDAEYLEAFARYKLALAAWENSADATFHIIDEVDGTRIVRID